MVKKTKLTKDKWLGARADADLDAKVTEYIDAADISMGDLIRRSVKEYLLNHPIKQPEPEVNLKPGE
jgi:cAMP phosphodiesterase